MYGRVGLTGPEKKKEERKKDEKELVSHKKPGKSVNINQKKATAIGNVRVHVPNFRSTIV